MTTNTDPMRREPMLTTLNEKPKTTPTIRNITTRTMAMTPPKTITRATMMMTIDLCIHSGRPPP
jgi:hypothetical protein